MTYPETFEGYGIESKETWNQAKKFTYPPKQMEDHDIDIEIECCGVCGSDVHVARGSWGDMYRPIIVGHEIVGKIVKIGSKVTDFNLGQRVGVGAQCKSCMNCNRCKEGNEQYCAAKVLTYLSKFEDGYNAQGGYASHIRVDDFYVFAIPDNVESEIVAPLLCGGITSFSPMLRYGVGPGTKVGISGIGGIGSMAILLAKALGAEVYAISRSDKKKNDAFKLGADHFIATDRENYDSEFFDSLDVLINCSSSLTSIDFTRLTKLMRIRGTIISISAPLQGELIKVAPTDLLGCVIGMTCIGNRQEIEQMLELVSKKNVKPWIEKIPINGKGVHEVLSRAYEGDVRYRFVLTDYDKEFK